MTIASEVNKSGPYTGDGVNTSFAYGFKIFHKNDIEVIKTTIASGVEEVLTVDVDYTVNSVGSDTGTITYPVSGSPLAATHKLTIIRDMTFKQEVDLENQGGYYPDVVEQVFDRIEMKLQQLKEVTDRAVTTDASSTTTPDELLTSIAAAVAAAQAAQAGAETAETNAETAETNAAASAAAASTSETNAATSEANAAASAAAAAGAVTYENLNTNGDVGTGSAQVAQGDHLHAGVYEPADADILKADTTDNLTVGMTTDTETLASDTITADFQAENLKTRAVAGNVTLNAPTTGNGVAHIKLAADGSGPYTVTLGSGVTALGTLPDLAASTTYIATIIRFGTSDAYVQISEAG